MYFSATMQEAIRDQLKSSPPKQGEMRRIEGMGELYAASPETPADESEYVSLYTVEVAGAEYRVYSKRS